MCSIKKMTLVSSLCISTTLCVFRFPILIRDLLLSLMMSMTHLNVSKQKEVFLHFQGFITGAEIRKWPYLLQSLWSYHRTLQSFYIFEAQYCNALYLIIRNAMYLIICNAMHLNLELTEHGQAGSAIMKDWILVAAGVERFFFFMYTLAFAFVSAFYI